MQVQVASLVREPYSSSEIEHEIDDMLVTIKGFDLDLPDVVMSESLALLARCTEIHVRLVRSEARDRKAKFIRTMQLEKVMSLLGEYFKGASRMIEVRRQEIELSR